MLSSMSEEDSEVRSLNGPLRLSMFIYGLGIDMIIAMMNAKRLCWTKRSNFDLWYASEALSFNQQQSRHITEWVFMQIHKLMKLYCTKSLNWQPYHGSVCHICPWYQLRSDWEQHSLCFLSCYCRGRNQEPHSNITQHSYLLKRWIFRQPQPELWTNLHLVPNLLLVPHFNAANSPAYLAGPGFFRGKGSVQALDATVIDRVLLC